MGKIEKCYGSLEDQENSLQKIKEILSSYNLNNLNVEKIDVTGDYDRESFCFFATDRFGYYRFWIYDNQLEYYFNAKNIEGECLLEIYDFYCDYHAMEKEYFRRMENDLNTFAA